MKLKLLILFCFTFCIAQASPPGFLYYKLLTTQENQITVGSTNLSNFPVLVRLTDPHLKHTSSGGYMQNVNGYDVIFTSSDGNTLIPFQIEKYDPVTGTLSAWVQVPVVSATVNTDFYLYFGNSSISTDPSSTSTWDLNYKGVYHVNTTRDDYTSNGQDLTSFNTSNQSPAVIADGEDIKPTQYLTRAPDVILQQDADLTIQTWVRFASALQNGNSENVLIACGANGITSNENYHYYFNYIGGGANAGKLRLFWEYNTKIGVTCMSTVAAAPGTGVWHQVTVVRDNANLVVKFYFDGIQVGANVAYVNPPDFGAGASFQVGAGYPGSLTDIDADFDEIRIAASVRGPEWIQATYETSKVGSTFVTYGTTQCVSSDISDAGPDQNVCTSTATMAANTLTVGTGFWTLVSGSGSATSPTSPTTGITGLAVGANVFKWTVSNGPCTSYSDNVTITRDANPTTANAGPDQNVCTTSATFAGNTPGIGTGMWTLISGSGVPTTPTSATSAVTGLSVGANVFQWTTSNGTCPSSSDQVTITRDVNPDISDAGLDQTVCSTTATFSANTPTIGIGTWSLISGAGTITSFNSPTSTVTGLGVGANVFQWTISNGTCPSSTDQVTINRNAPPTTANAGPDQTICSSSTTLTGNTPIIGNGTWLLVSGTGTITSPTSPTTTVTGLSVGVNAFRWRIQNLPCPSSRDTVYITVDPAPTVSNAGLDQVICSSSTSFTANTPVIGTGTWSLISGSGTITTFNSPTSSVTGLGVGANVFQWTISNGTCTPSVDQVTITRDANPTTANAGPDQTICALTSSVFAGNTPVSGTGVWTLISGTGSPTSPTSPTSAVTGLNVGANIFQWTITNGTCPSSSDQITITVDPSPTVSNAGPDQTICASASVFAGNTPGVGTGMWTLISGSGVPTTPSSPSSAVTGLGLGANVFQWTITSGVCPPSTDQVTITRDANPSTANAGVDQTICSGTSAFTGNIPVTGTGLWTLISGTGTITTPTSASSSVTGLSVGANVFQWTISNGTCPSSSDQVTITRDPLPTTANAGPDQTICSSTSAFAGNTPGVGTGLWTLISGSGVITTPNSAVSSVTGLGTGANVFQWTITNGTCPPSSDQVTITRDPLPTTANAGPDQTICTSTASFAGNAPVIGSGLWTLVSGSGTITTPTSPTSGVTGLSVGANVFQWTISNGTCPPSSDQVTITRDPLPTTANAGPDQTICSATSAFAGNIPGTGTGLWTLISGSGVITTPTSATSSVTGLGVGANVFQWTISNGTCPPSSDQVTITRDPLPTTANAGPDQTICSATSTFAGNTPLIGTGVWTLVSGTGTITTPTAPTSGVTGLSVGANVFQWTISNGTCPPSSDQITINVDPLPTVANAGPDQTICSATSSFAGNPPVTGTGLWTLISGTGVITTPTSPTSGVTGLSIGANVFQWTISNGTCPPSSDQITINVDPLPTASNAGPDQTICASSSSLAGNTPLIGTGVWTLVSGTGTITTSTSPTSSVTGLSVGANVFQWTISNGTCPPSSDQITINVDPLPTASNAGPDQTICNALSYFAGNTPLIGTGVWTLISGTGTITSPSSPVSGVNGLSIGANVFQWTISNGTCPSSSDQVTINVDPLPTVANAGPDQTICTSSSVFAANTPLIGTGVWTLLAGTGTITASTSPTSTVTGLSVGANIFQWTISNGTCPPSFDQITINVDPLPTVANAGPDQTICSSNGTFAGNPPVTGTGLWTLVSGSGTINTPSSPSSTVSGLSVGVNIFQWTISNGTCPSSSDQVTINVDPLPTVSNAGPDQTICSSSSVFAANTPVIGTGIWALISGTGTITTPTSPISTVTSLGVGANVFQWIISNGTCPPSIDQITINVDPLPTVSNAGPDQTICSSNGTFAGNPPVNGSGFWTLVSGSGIIATPTSPSSTVSGLSTGANVFQWTITSGTCPSSSDQVTITVDPLPTASNAGPDQTLCANTTSFAANIPLIGTGTWQLISGTGTITTFNSPTSSVSGLTPGQNKFQWIITNGTCPPSRDTVIINVDAYPSASNAGADQFICTSSTVFTGNAPTIGVGTWTLVSGSGNITSINSPTSGLTGINVGQNVFVWTITNGTCPPTRDTVMITRDPQPTASLAGPDQNICSSSAIMAANPPIIGTGTWNVISGVGVITSFTSPTTSVTGMNPGLNVFEWVITNGSCPPSRDTIVINVNALPSTANAGFDQYICAPTATMTATTPTIGTGIWTLVSGSGFPTSPNSPTTGVTSINVGTNVFVWTVTNGNCPSSRDTVVIIRDPMPTAPQAGPDQLLCVTFTNFAGNTPTVGTGTWSIVSGTGNISTFNSPTSAVSGLSVGQNIFVWITNNGSCTSNADTVILTVLTAPPPSTAGTDQNLCALNTTLIGNIPQSGNGIWTLVSGTGTISNPTSNNTPVSGLQIGVNTFRWTTTINTCPSTSDDVDVMVYDYPTPSNAGIDDTISISSVHVNANVPTVGTGLWSVIAGTANIVDPTDPNTEVNGLIEGTTAVLRWTISNGPCSDVYSDVNITVKDLDIPNGFSPDGDGVNDLFVIDRLEEFDNVLFEVFNRWGNIVYKNSQYKNDWDGKNNDGAELSDDTYYFVLGVTENRIYKGYIVMKRK